MTLPHLTSALCAGDLVFVSGQLAFADDGTIAGDVGQQTLVILKKIAAIINEHGLTPTDIVKANVWLTDVVDFPAFNEAYAAFFGDHRPTRSTVVSQLAITGAKIEIDAIASFSVNVAKR